MFVLLLKCRMSRLSRYRTNAAEIPYRKVTAPPAPRQVMRRQQDEDNRSTDNKIDVQIF
jgi:hypothetical protein